MHVSNKQAAVQDKCRHSFQPGIGYINHGEHPPLPEVRGRIPNSGTCEPPPGTLNGSRHILSYQGRDLEFTWSASEHAWERPFGNRLAWTTAHLTAAGWLYVREA